MDIGDSVFLRNRVVGVVVDKQPDGRLCVEQEGSNFDRTRNIGFINGLSVGERQEFFSVMEEIRGLPDAVSRYESLAGKIEELREKNRELEATKAQQPADKQEEILKKQQATRNVLRYLQAELNHIASCKNIVPKIYTAEPQDL